MTPNSESEWDRLEKLAQGAWEFQDWEAFHELADKHFLALLAERKRFREALKTIRDDIGDPAEFTPYALAVRGIARQALSPERKEEKGDG